MKDEIKEILLKFNKEVEKAELTRNPYSSEDKKFKHIIVSLSEEHFNIFKDALDYITNLQEENDELRNEVKELNRMCELYGKSIYNAELTDYKSRNKKAIEFIKEKGCYYSGDFDDILDLYDLNDLLNILNGDDEE